MAFREAQLLVDQLHWIRRNGSRGKSSTTRLVAAALRADPSHMVVAKTTGSAARFIYPNARETPIERRHRIVNVIEQVGVVARAWRLSATHLVLECMAVDPELQRLNQEVLVQSHIEPFPVTVGHGV